MLRFDVYLLWSAILGVPPAEVNELAPVGHPL